MHVKMIGIHPLYSHAPQVEVEIVADSVRLGSILQGRRHMHFRTQQFQVCESTTEKLRHAGTRGRGQGVPTPLCTEVTI